MEALPPPPPPPPPPAESPPPHMRSVASASSLTNLRESRTAPELVRGNTNSSRWMLVLLTLMVVMLLTNMFVYKVR
jgi:hypothetical protein